METPCHWLWDPPRLEPHRCGSELWGRPIGGMGGGLGPLENSSSPSKPQKPPPHKSGRRRACADHPGALCPNSACAELSSPPPRSEVLICIAPPLSGLGGGRGSRPMTSRAPFPAPPAAPLWGQGPRNGLGWGGRRAAQGILGGERPHPIATHPHTDPQPPPKKKTLI